MEIEVKKLEDGTKKDISAIYNYYVEEITKLQDKMQKLLEQRDRYPQWFQRFLKKRTERINEELQPLLEKSNKLFERFKEVDELKTDPDLKKATWLLLANITTN